MDGPGPFMDGLGPSRDGPQPPSPLFAPAFGLLTLQTECYIANKGRYVELLIWFATLKLLFLLKYL